MGGRGGRRERGPAGRFGMVAVTVFSLLAVPGGVAVAPGGPAGFWGRAAAPVSSLPAVGAGTPAPGGAPPPAVTLEQTGHWVYNSAAGAALHVDGGTRRTDARVDIPDPPAEPLFTVQGAT